MVRFVHTADWQLGLHRAWLDDGAQARFGQARIDVIDAIGRLARDRGAAFVVVAGDVFDSNHTDRRTVVRALDRLAHVGVPVLLLPGNHDARCPGSVYDSPTFVDRCPPGVTVLGDEPVPVGDDAEVVGVPWTANEMLTDAVAERIAQLDPADRRARVVVAHGIVDRLRIDRHAPGVIDTGVVEAALADGRVHFLALGDRHSTTDIGASGRIWYAGAPEPTRFTEIAAGNALVVDVDDTACSVEPVRVGTWRFVQRELVFTGTADVDALAEWAAAIDDPARTIVRLRCEGVVPLRAMARFEELVDDVADALACLDVHGPGQELVALPDEDDLDALDCGPATRATIEELAAAAASGGDHRDAVVAAAALGVLYRAARIPA